MNRDELVERVAELLDSYDLARAALAIIEPVLNAKSDAMQDSAYIAGMTAGWNFAMSSDHEGMMSARNNREGYLAAIRAGAKP